MLSGLSRGQDTRNQAEEIEAQECMAVVKTHEEVRTKTHLTTQEIGQKYLKHLVCHIHI